MRLRCVVAADPAQTERVAGLIPAHPEHGLTVVADPEIERLEVAPGLAIGHSPHDVERDRIAVLDDRLVGTQIEGANGERRIPDRRLCGAGEDVAFTADDKSTKKVSFGSWMPSPSIVTLILAVDWPGVVG